MDASKIIFPLHEGTVNYLQRNRPSFLRRYSNLLGVLITFLIALISGLFTLMNYRKAQKNEKIDIYYGRLETIRTESSQLMFQTEVESKLKEMRKMEQEAIELIISEKLSANHSYLVFMRMVDLAK